MGDRSSQAHTASSSTVDVTEEIFSGSGISGDRETRDGQAPYCAQVFDAGVSGPRDLLKLMCDPTSCSSLSKPERLAQA